MLFVCFKTNKIDCIFPLQGRRLKYWKSIGRLSIKYCIYVYKGLKKKNYGLFLYESQWNLQQTLMLRPFSLWVNFSKKDYMTLSLIWIYHSLANSMLICYTYGVNVDNIPGTHQHVGVTCNCLNRKMYSWIKGQHNYTFPFNAAL